MNTWREVVASVQNRFSPLFSLHHTFLVRNIHKEIPVQAQTLLWEHVQEMGLINQKAKGT